MIDSPALIVPFLWLLVPFEFPNVVCGFSGWVRGLMICFNDSGFLEQKFIWPLNFISLVLL